jgi:SAM-dependent methyltransferase
LLKELRLPDQAHTSKTNDEDPIEYYYRPFTGRVYRRRLEMALGALGNQRFEHVLEIGCGSGVFLPALCGRAEQVSAFDLHKKMALVQKMLRGEAVRANLWTGDVLRISAADEAFDGVVCLSVLEHLAGPALIQALGEIRRVSRMDATIVLGFPCRNILTDTFYRVFGFSPRSIHPSSHRDIRRAIDGSLRIEESRRFAPWLPTSLDVYAVCRCVRT